MPLFLDVHSLDDPVTLNDVTHAHAADLRTQGRHDISYRRSWWMRSPPRSSLSSTPSADVAADVHREAHGLVAQEIYQVTEGRH
jgi:hypothetical protein